jgi:S1-C subfamily serine protease
VEQVIRCPQCRRTYRVPKHIATDPFACTTCRHMINGPQAAIVAPAEAHNGVLSPPPRLPTANTAKRLPPRHLQLDLRLGDTVFPGWLWISAVSFLVLAAVGLSTIGILSEPGAERANAQQATSSQSNREAWSTTIPSPATTATDVPAVLEESAHRKKSNSLTPSALFEACSPAVVWIAVYDRTGEFIGSGSGFYISSRGLLVTNYHVIDGGMFFKASDQEKRATPLQVVAMDSEADLALLYFARTSGPTLLLAENDLPAVGNRAYAIGSPRGLANSLSEGLISGHRELPGGLTLIQTTTPMSPGSSGGPLLDESGRVLGVTTLGLADSQNLNFVVPVERIRRLLGRREN